MDATEIKEAIVFVKLYLLGPLGVVGSWEMEQGSGSYCIIPLCSSKC